MKLIRLFILLACSLGVSVDHAFAMDGATPVFVPQRHACSTCSGTVYSHQIYSFGCCNYKICFECLDSYLCMNTTVSTRLFCPNHACQDRVIKLAELDCIGSILGGSLAEDVIPRLKTMCCEQEEKDQEEDFEVLSGSVSSPPVSPVKKSNITPFYWGSILGFGK